MKEQYEFEQLRELRNLQETETENPYTGNEEDHSDEVDNQKLNIRDVIKDIIIVVVIVGVIGFFVKPIIVEGASMNPTLQDGNYLLISKQSYHFGEPERGDIIVFPHHENAGDSLYIKRVIAIPGDHLEIHDGNVYINGELQDEDYIKSGAVTEGSVDLVIPEGQIFVMGDNRENSSDSRYFGTVNIEEVTGEVFVRLWPLSEIGRP